MHLVRSAIPIKVNTNFKHTIEHLEFSFKRKNISKTSLPTTHFQIKVISCWLISSADYLHRYQIFFFLDPFKPSTDTFFSFFFFNGYGIANFHMKPDK